MAARKNEYASWFLILADDHAVYEHETIEQNTNLLIKIESRKFRIYFKWKRLGKIRHGSPPHFNCLEIMLRLINSRSN
jgi:hypothetical protein